MNSQRNNNIVQERAERKACRKYNTQHTQRVDNRRSNRRAKKDTSVAPCAFGKEELRRRSRSATLAVQEIDIGNPEEGKETEKGVHRPRDVSSYRRPVVVILAWAATITVRNSDPPSAAKPSRYGSCTTYHNTISIFRSRASIKKKRETNAPEQLPHEFTEIDSLLRGKVERQLAAVPVHPSGYVRRKDTEKRRETRLTTDTPRRQPP